MCATSRDMTWPKTQSHVLRDDRFNSGWRRGKTRNILMKLHWKLIIGSAVICYVLALFSLGYPYRYTFGTFEASDWLLYLVDSVGGMMSLSLWLLVPISIAYLIPIHEDVGVKENVVQRRAHRRRV